MRILGRTHTKEGIGIAFDADESYHDGGRGDPNKARSAAEFIADKLTASGFEDVVITKREANIK